MSHDFQADLDAVAGISAVPLILEVVCRTTGMGFAAVARVTEDRWIACKVRDRIAFGLEPGGELDVQTTICNDIRTTRRPVVIDNVADDPTYRGHRTPARYGFQSYISMPIVLPGGEFFGTLCAIDPKPARLDTPQIVGMFKLFAELIGFHLSADRRLAASEASLLTERQGAELREQFIAVLGHDLRNPLAAIDAGTRLLLRTPLTEKAVFTVGQMQATVKRMSGLITNLLDFARGRLGGGFVLERAPVTLAPVLEQVTSEVEAILPGRTIERDFGGLGAVDCDPARIGQMLANLLGNAATHGIPGGPVQVAAHRRNGLFELSVANRGDPIPPATIPYLFQPFFRASEGGQGLGLGLYIASEIARAHGGSLTAASGEGETRFIFRMPQARD
jgi:signal transduction histidine kinase